jgi:hypothetical protein
MILACQSFGQYKALIEGICTSEGIASTLNFELADEYPANKVLANHNDFTKEWGGGGGAIPIPYAINRIRTWLGLWWLLAGFNTGLSL